MKRLLTLIAAITITFTAMSQNKEKLPSWNDLADGKVHSLKGPGYYHADISEYIFNYSSGKPSTFTLDKYSKLLSITTVKRTMYEREMGDKQFIMTMRMDTIKTLLEVDYNEQDLKVVKIIDGSHPMDFEQLKIVQYEDGVGLEDSEHTRLWILEMPKKDK